MAFDIVFFSRGKQEVGKRVQYHYFCLIVYSLYIMKISRSQAEYSIAPWVLDSAVQITSDNIDNMGIAKYSLLILERIRDRYETIKEIGTELQNTRLKVEK